MPDKCPYCDTVLPETDKITYDKLNKWGLLNTICAEKAMPESFEHWQYMGSFDLDFLEAMISLIHKKCEPINNQVSVFLYKGKIAPLIANFKRGRPVWLAPRDNPSWTVFENREERGVRLFFENVMR